MSPKRAAQIADQYRGEWEDMNCTLRQMIARAILAACAEERKAVLTEAAKVADAWGVDASVILNLIDKEDV